MTLHSAVAAVGLAFIYIVFVAGLCVVLDIAPFPKGVLLGIDNWLWWIILIIILIWVCGGQNGCCGDNNNCCAGCGC